MSLQSLLFATLCVSVSATTCADVQGVYASSACCTAAPDAAALGVTCHVDDIADLRTAFTSG